MRGPEFRNVRLALAGVLALTVSLGVDALISQRIGISRDGIVQTTKCEDPNIKGCKRRVTLVRFPSLVSDENSARVIARINNFFQQQLEENTGGYQEDIITSWASAPRSRRVGVLNVFRDNREDMILDFKKKVGDKEAFRVRVSNQGIEELSGQEPLDQIYPFLGSLFDENGFPKGYIEADQSSPYRIWPKLRSLSENDLFGNKLRVLDIPLVF